MKREPIDLNAYRLWKKWKSSRVKAKRRQAQQEYSYRQTKRGSKLYGDPNTTGRRESASSRNKRKRREARDRVGR